MLNSPLLHLFYGHIEFLLILLVNFLFLSIYSLIVSLMNASQDIAVQAVVAVSDEDQINKIKKHCNNINGSFNGKLKFWNINEIERAYNELSSSMEIINKAINVEINM